MNESMNMSVSGIFQKDGKKCISVLFTDGKKSAEGYIPACKIHKNEGFAEEEIAALEFYMKSEKMNIVAMAKRVNVMKAFMGEK